MSERFAAFHLPGLKPAETVEIQARDLILRVPKLSATDISDIGARLRSAKSALARVPTPDIVDAIDRAAGLLAEPGSELRDEALRLLPLATGFSPQMCEMTLDRMAVDWRRDALQTLLHAEFGSVEALEDFVSDPQADRRFTVRGPDLCLHIFSGNVPGVAVTSLVRALLVRGPSLGKSARGEPVLPVLFARAIQSVAPTIGQAIAVTYWPTDRTDLLAAAAAEADVTVVYGGTDAVRAARAVAPANARVVVHGPRLSIGVVGQAALTSEADARHLAKDIALATATFDQQGCVSPHATFVQHGAAITPRELAGFVAEELEQLQAVLPRASLSPAEAAAVREARARAEFAAYAGAETAVLPATDTAFAVIYDPRHEFQLSCLNRVLYVKTFTEISEFPEILAAHRISLQSAAVAGFPDDQAANAARILVETGLTRITTFDRLPFPPATWHHDGSLPLRELVRYIDWEPPARSST